MAIAELNQSVALNPDNLVAKQALEKTITLKETSEKEAAKHNSRGEAFIKNKNLDQATKEFGWSSRRGGDDYSRTSYMGASSSLCIIQL